MGERQFGPYRLVRQIAVGGMAEIHLAKTKGIAGFEKYVALKMIHPNFAEDEQFIQMLVDEAKIAVQLTHGNIAQTFDLGRVGETYYITMEYVDGADLYKILRRGSERDLELPLDVCAFIGKEIASALDHAHRKRDNFGKNLGIVHRDVSPQNVLVSYAGEVKLVDFGIAKATMKARQTAVGVIKGKYYYMSPEQAWGDQIDYRSDIFSAGIVLYEMITGQMLYLEEDLQKLLDMARAADIAPPSKLRRGVPPQLERIVMHALQKRAEDRYQSAGDFATDLERFLHAYSPVFTAGKIAAMIRNVVGDPSAVPDPQDFPSIEMRDGTNATHTLNDDDLLKARDELHDENSVIFRVAELTPGARSPGEPAPAPAVAVAARPSPKPAPRTTRPADPLPPVSVPSKIPSIARPAAEVARPARPSPRNLHEETRELAMPPAGSGDEVSGLLDPAAGRRVAPVGKPVENRGWDAGDTRPELDDADMGDRTMVTSPGSLGGAGSFTMDFEDSVDATVVTEAPQRSDFAPPAGARAAPDEATLDVAAAQAENGDDDDEGPTLMRAEGSFAPRPSRGKPQPPAALAAKIHAPAVSALRQPKARRGTPPGGVTNVLQQIMGSQASEPMPVPVARPAEPTHHAEPPSPPQLASPSPSPHGSYQSDASGLPLGLHTPAGTALPQAPGAPPHHQPYLHMQGQPPQPHGHPGYPPAPGYGSPQGYPGYPQQQVTPGGLYQLSPYGAPPQPMTLTGQLRLTEGDELPSHYRLGAARRRWFAYIAAGLIAVSVAAAATFFIIRTTRDSAPSVGSIHVTSVPPGAEIIFDGERLTEATPATIRNITVGTRHEVRVELARHKPYVETIDLPSSGREVPVMALLQPVTGKLRIVSKPDNAEIWLDGKLVGRTPKTLESLDIATGAKLELRLKDYQPHLQDLRWPANGQIDLDIKLQP